MANTESTKLYGTITQVEESEIPKVTAIQTQNGVFRTNCMDCLDRTNVVQSVIARNILLSQLHSVRFSNHRLASFKDLMEILSKNFQEILKSHSENFGAIMPTESVFSILEQEH